MALETRRQRLRLIVEAARHAPSVHNTRPWLFAVTPAGLELSADPSRRLPVLDPDGHQLLLSCGAALFHARVAARALGLAVDVELFPGDGGPDLLARLHLSPGGPATRDETAIAAAILHRHTYRGVFVDRGLPPGLLTRLRRDTEAEGAVLKEVSTTEDLVQLDALLSRASAAQERSQAYRDELRSRLAADSAQANALTVPLPRRAPGSSEQQRNVFVGLDLDDPATHGGALPRVVKPAVVVVGTDEDDRPSRLRAGQAVAALLLRAADSDVQAQPLGQVTDAVGYRTQLGLALGMLTTPQLVLRLGVVAGSAADADADADRPRADVPAGVA